MKKNIYALLTVIFLFVSLGMYAQIPDRADRYEILDHHLQHMVAADILTDQFNVGYKSCGIWVRYYDDDGTEHQAPDCNILPNWIYIKITNISDERSSEFDYLKINWTVANLSPNVLMSGNGEYPTLTGNVGDRIRIPSMEPGETKIIKIPWNVPCPQDGHSQGFCINVVINTAIDMIFDDRGNPQIVYNQKSYWKNITIITPRVGEMVGGRVMVGNFFEYARAFDLKLKQCPITLEDLENRDNMEPVFNRAKVIFTMDEVMVRAWERGGARLENIERMDENRFRIVSNNAKFDDLVLMPGEIGYVNLDFMFMELNPDTQYEYDLVLTDAKDEKEMIGCNTFRVIRNDGSDPSTINGYIKELSPNPAREELYIYSYFERSDVRNAYIRITNIATSYSNTYRLDMESRELHLNIGNYPNGVYVAYLVCDGQVVDSRTFIKE